MLRGKYESVKYQAHKKLVNAAFQLSEYAWSNFYHTKRDNT